MAYNEKYDSSYPIIFNKIKSGGGKLQIKPCLNSAKGKKMESLQLSNLDRLVGELHFFKERKNLMFNISLTSVPHIIMSYQAFLGEVIKGNIKEPTLVYSSPVKFLNSKKDDEGHPKIYSFQINYLGEEKGYSFKVANYYGIVIDNDIQDFQTDYQEGEMIFNGEEMSYLISELSFLTDIFRRDKFQNSY